MNEGAIRKRAKRDDGSRDLAEKVQENADDLVLKAEVRKQGCTETYLIERVLLEATAEVIAPVPIEHRGDINGARKLANILFDELQAQYSVDEFGEMLRSPGDWGTDWLNELY